jgi:xanthine dehydrogenase accessory factor
MSLITLILGGGDLASGVAMRLYRAGLSPIITELAYPLVVRRHVSFAEAVYEGQFTVEEITAQSVPDLKQALVLRVSGVIPVLVDPQVQAPARLQSMLPESASLVLVDARMTKRPTDLSLDSAPLVIGLGPGFKAGENCHAVIETMRGHLLGRVIWQGEPQGDTGIPDPVSNRSAERVLRAPADGELRAFADIGDHLEAGQIVAEVSDEPVCAPFKGVLRGLIHPQHRVWKGLKIGDVDPRDDPRYCRLVSDKALAIGGAVLEAILSRADLRAHLWAE